MANRSVLWVFIFSLDCPMQRSLRFKLQFSFPQKLPARKYMRRFNFILGLRPRFGCPGGSGTTPRIPRTGCPVAVTIHSALSSPLSPLFVQPQTSPLGALRKYTDIVLFSKTPFGVSLPPNSNYCTRPGFAPARFLLPDLHSLLKFSPPLLLSSGCCYTPFPGRAAQHIDLRSSGMRFSAGNESVLLC